jgi:predicted kinase
MADLIANDIGATVSSFDWLMSGLRAVPEVWDATENPVERQRRVGWNLLSRVAEQQLRRGSSCVLDLVAREEPRSEWARLASSHGAKFAVIECRCSDESIHRSRVEARDRDIPGWYEMTWEWVERGRRLYVPLDGPKFELDAVQTVQANFARVQEWLNTQ